MFIVHLFFQSRLKRKLDGSSAEQPNHLDNSVYSYDEDDSPAANKKQATVTKNIENPLGPSLSVQIVQQISTQPEHNQTIHTNVTVSSTLKSRFGNLHSEDATPQPQPTAPAAPQQNLSVTCKQEREENNHCNRGTSINQGANNLSDLLFDADFEAIIASLAKKENEDISPDLFKQLNEFDEVWHKVARDSEKSEDVNLFSAESPSVQKSSFPSNIASHSVTINTVFESNQNMNPVQSPPAIPSYRSPAGQLTEAGPAAETLKQMAAQHHAKSPSLQTFEEPPYPRNGFQNNFPAPTYSALQQASSSGQTFTFSQHQQATNQPRPPGQPYSARPDKPEMNYGATKPLSHFSERAASVGQSQGTPPLQQLQNQVHSHFSQTPDHPTQQITQTQHMQVSHNAQSQLQMSQTQQSQLQLSQTQQSQLQMSQTQQLQLQQQQISMSQQQSISMTTMGQQQIPPYMNDQMNMQMMQEKRQRQQKLQEQQQMMEQQQQAQMQQYINRPPPPEYKMQASGNSTPYNANGVGPNPLQTMQNMVNQTSHSIQAGFRPVKTEIHANMMPAGQASTLQQQRGQKAAFAAQQMQQRQYAAAQTTQMNHATQAIPSMQASRNPRPAAPTYTSAIMRNQRPPNVNVGPEGLNISQPRNTHEWPRGMVPTQGQMMGARPSMPGGGATMMQYGQYGQGNMPQSVPMQGAPTPQMRQQQQITAMQSQTAMIQQGNNAQVLMQQNMQMSQRLSARPTGQPGANAAPYSMPNAVAVPGQAIVSNPQGNFSNTNTVQPDFMDILNNVQNSNSDFFDEASASDFNLLDEILGK